MIKQYKELPEEEWLYQLICELLRRLSRNHNIMMRIHKDSDRYIERQYSLYRRVTTNDSYNIILQRETKEDPATHMSV